jgi:5-(carboxyamino)imidazole ribonucleotide synthase
MTTARKSIGILGGGQLALMLAQAAHDLGHDVVGLIKSLDEPLAQLPFVKVLTAESLGDFARSIDVLCFESEFFDLRQVEAIRALNPDVSLRPGIDTMLRLRDKLEQKKLFETLSIAQPAYLEIRSSHFEADLAEVARLFGKGFVVKRALGGYDGKGNYFVNDARAAALNSGLREFCEKGFSESSHLYAEQRVDFERELAIVAVVSASRGEFISYPLMLTKQVSGACQEVWGPAVPMGVEPEYALQASRWAMSVAKNCPDLACFALEFFLDRDRGLLVNELAPRVHNSGHFTLLERERSQFHNHIRSLVDESLAPFNPHGFYLMRNLLSPRELGSRPVDPEHVEELRPLWPGEFAWYGKTILAPGRKMGHVSLRQEDAKAIERARLDLESRESGFWGRLKA